MNKFLFVSGLVFLTTNSFGAFCGPESGPISRESLHFVDSVVWRLRVAEPKPELDSSASIEERSTALIRKISDLMKRGADSKKPGNFLTQDDLGVIAEFLARYHFKMNEILQARSRIGVDEKLSADQITEAQRFLSDFSYVRGRMDEYEEYEGMRCHFAYGERMWKDINHPDSARVRREYGLKALTDDRAVIGDCWNRDLP